MDGVQRRPRSRRRSELSRPAAPEQVTDGSGAFSVAVGIPAIRSASAKKSLRPMERRRRALPRGFAHDQATNRSRCSQANPHRATRTDVVKNELVIDEDCVAPRAERGMHRGQQRWEGIEMSKEQRCATRDLDVGEIRERSRRECAPMSSATRRSPTPALAELP